MKVFVSWSGEPSKTVAQALREWLPDVIQGAKPWVSASDIDAGARWSRKIQEELNSSRFGIVCVTRENQHAPWLLFEAGALAKTIDDAFVCPYLVDLEPSQLDQGPLTQFQAKRATYDDTLDLVRAINRAAKEEGRPDDKVERAFSRWWSDLDGVIKRLPKVESSPPVVRRVDDMLAEMLDLTREMYRLSRDPDRTPQPDWVSRMVERLDQDKNWEERMKRYITSADPQKVRLWAQLLEASVAGDDNVLEALRKAGGSKSTS